MYSFGARCNKCKLPVGSASKYRIDAETDGRAHSRATQHPVSIWYVTATGRYVKHAKPTSDPAYTTVYATPQGA